MFSFTCTINVIPGMTLPGATTFVQSNQKLIKYIKINVVIKFITINSQTKLYLNTMQVLNLNGNNLTIMKKIYNQNKCIFGK